jgi:hypothetical protein
MADSPNLDTSPCSPEQISCLQRSPRLHPPDGLQGSSTEPSVSTLHMLHDVVAVESEDYAALHKTKLFYSQRAASGSSSMAHSARHMPQWGQELLMLYREPPPWSQAQIPPIVKAPSRPRSHEGLVTVDRANERTMKSVQEMRDILSQRHRSMKKPDGFFNSAKASTKLPVSRNPFAVRSEEPSAPVHDRADEETSTLPHAGTTAKSTAVKPKTFQSLRPITSLPIPIPPDSSKLVSGNKIPDSGPSPCRLRHDSNRNSRQNNAFREQGTDTSLVRPIRRSDTDKVGPTAARKRSRAAASVGGSGGAKGFDWSSWGTR